MVTCNAMKIHEVNFNLSFDSSEAIRVLKPSDAMLDECRAVSTLLNGTMRGKSLIVLYNDMEVGETSISLGGKCFECGSRIAGALKGAVSAAVFVATLGDKVTECYNRLQNSYDYLMAYWLDQLANVAVDRMLNHIRTGISEMAAQSGMSITSNWGPGYCLWPLSDQCQFISLIPGAEKLVSLTDSMLMLPMKSLAGVIGIGYDVKYHVSGCSDCGLDYCFYRNQCR